MAVINTVHVYSYILTSSITVRNFHLPPNAFTPNLFRTLSLCGHSLMATASCQNMATYSVSRTECRINPTVCSLEKGSSIPLALEEQSCPRVFLETLPRSCISTRVVILSKQFIRKQNKQQYCSKLYAMFK